MRRIIATAAGLAIGIIASLVLQATIGRTAPQQQSYGPPIGPVMSTDTGASELLLVVLGDIYPTRADAEAANDQMPFGDLAGYYVVPVAQFQGFKEQVGTPGDFALVSVFRTELGAQVEPSLTDVPQQHRQGYGRILRAVDRPGQALLASDELRRVELEPRSRSGQAWQVWAGNWTLPPGVNGSWMLLGQVRVACSKSMVNAGLAKRPPGPRTGNALQNTCSAGSRSRTNALAR